MYQLVVSDHFSSAHFLRGYQGACENLHGHTWKVEVAVESDQLNQIGLVIDFKELKKRLGHIMERWDHVCLNDLDEFQGVNPSTENMARVLYQAVAREFPGAVISYVRVWESDTASVIYRP